MQGRYGTDGPLSWLSNALLCCLQHIGHKTGNFESCHQACAMGHHNATVTERALCGAVLPDFDNWANKYVAVTFDGDPAREYAPLFVPGAQQSETAAAGKCQHSDSQNIAPGRNALTSHFNLHHRAFVHLELRCESHLTGYSQVQSCLPAGIHSPHSAMFRLSLLHLHVSTV